MKYKTRKNPLFAACGLNCGLCPRHYTEGTSKCPGCAGEGFSDVHPTCGVLSCCQRKGIEYCFQCDEFPCAKYKDTGKKDSFITHRSQFRDMERAILIGIDAYETELNDNVKILKSLLNDYDDGRRKSYFCTAVNLFELEDLGKIMEQLSTTVDINAPLKEKAAAAVHLFELMAEEREISLKLQK